MLLRHAIILSLFSVILAGCQPPSSDMTRTVSVTGHAESLVAPDQAKLTISVNRDGAELADIKQQIDQVSASIIAFLREQQIDDADITSFKVSASPAYDYQDGKRVARGFTATRQIQITLRDLTQYDSIVDQALQAGATHIMNVEFIISETDKIYQQLLASAVEHARQKASNMTSAAGSTLGEVISIQESSHAPAVSQQAMMRMQEAADVSLPGKNELRAQVSVTYRIRD
ncbi:SIMPL domain-containing protein [Pseudidiomarina marina]|uniref:SIMPL domain-containing protein n=1 Tax=Pseudidiomarina marina TaxID=502366 RepID=UPI000C11F899|nr:MAG: hypothetical protein COA51_03295 [Idiomarina sp.]